MKILKHHKFNILITLFVFSICIFSSCSSVKDSIYKNDFPLTSQKAFSKDSSYYILIPKGWFYSYDNKCNCSDIFLIRNDFKASLSLVPIYINSKLNFDSQKFKLINYSQIMKQSELKSELIQIGNPEFFIIDNLKCVAYKYYNNYSLPVRTILFEFNNHFYELNAYITDVGLMGKLFPNTVYNAQNTILDSLKKININKE